MGFQMDDYNHGLIDYLIIGGGVAGLAVANRLADLQCSSLLIEAGQYPSQKVCGEFLSPECLPILADWGIFPFCKTTQVKLFKNHLSLNFSLPDAAAGMSRNELEESLLSRAQKKGCQVVCQCKVLEIKDFYQGSEKCYLVKASDGKVFKAQTLFIGAGRLVQSAGTSPPKMQYMGFKAHFKGVDVENCLQMHLLPQAYLGIAQVEKEIVNVACLANIGSEVARASSLEDYLFSQPRIKALLAKGEIDSVGWLKTEVPGFTIKKTPDWENAYFIGDAAGTIPPATGDGLSMAITSGVLAANYALKKEAKGFKNAWKKHYSSRIMYGKMLHHVMTQPVLSTLSILSCKVLPFLPKTIFSLTRT